MMYLTQIADKLGISLKLTKKEEKHQQYDNYIAGFYEASEARVTILKEKYKKEGKEWSSGLESKITTLRPD